MRIAGLIVAAGRGTRAQTDLPKQYNMLGNKTVLEASIRALASDPRITSIQVVIHPDDATLYSTVEKQLSDLPLAPVVTGSTTRQGSVSKGLAAIDSEYVLIHDAARPFLSSLTLSAVIDATLQHDAAFPALSVTDALWKKNHGIADVSVPREDLVRAQTPQGFRTDLIKEAFQSFEGEALDDVAVVRAFGADVHFVEGDPENTKLTYPEDFKLTKVPDIRVGNGYDVHAFSDGTEVTLNGISIPFNKGLSGHSDADVPMHTITDAIFGALAEGDIGQWFPPSDPQWKGAASDIFLKKACERAQVRGFEITSVDCTIICEAPKIGPYALAMRETLSEIMALPIDRISVKATTSERLGFTGREEGIACQATATLVKI